MNESKTSTEIIINCIKIDENDKLMHLIICVLMLIQIIDY